MGPAEPTAVAVSDTVRFNALWTAHAGRVWAYACRHVDHETAQEVVSETFLVAWRRLSDVPGDPLPWLIVVARNTVSGHQRSSYRRSALQNQLEALERVAPSAMGADVTATERAETLRALAALTGNEREALLLIAWDGLTSADAAAVAGCTAAAFHVRLHRARRRLRAIAKYDDEPSVSAPSARTAEHTRSTA